MTESCAEIQQRKRQGRITGHAGVVQLLVALFGAEGRATADGWLKAGEDIVRWTKLTRDRFYNRTSPQPTNQSVAQRNEMREQPIRPMVPAEQPVAVAGERERKAPEKSAEELIVTAQLSTLFAKVLPDDFFVFHQVPPEEGRIDVSFCIGVGYDKDLVPVGVLEAGKEPNACQKKAAQLLAYINNTWVSYTRFQHTLQLGITCEVGKAVCLKAFYQDREHHLQFGGSRAVIKEVEIFTAGWTPQAFALIAHALVVVSTRILDAQHHQFDAHGRHAVRIGNDVMKVFDHRGRQSITDHNGSIKFLGAEVVLNECNGQLIIIKYPFLPGTHVPRRLVQFFRIIENLVRVHNEGWVHGDVRLANMVFGNDEESGTLIDFDLSGPRSVRRYPAGYNADINDGYRHEDAVSGSTLEIVHDWFSLGSIIEKLFVLDHEAYGEEDEVVKQKRDENFLELARCVVDGRLVQAIELANLIDMDYPVKLSDVVPNFAPAHTLRKRKGGASASNPDPADTSQAQSQKKCLKGASSPASVSRR